MLDRVCVVMPMGGDLSCGSSQAMRNVHNLWAQLGGAHETEAITIA